MNAGASSRARKKTGKEASPRTGEQTRRRTRRTPSRGTLRSVARAEGCAQPNIFRKCYAYIYIYIYILHLYVRTSQYIRNITYAPRERPGLPPAGPGEEPLRTIRSARRACAGRAAQHTHPLPPPRALLMIRNSRRWRNACPLS
jgi:hypothetical protein